MSWDAILLLLGTLGVLLAARVPVAIAIIATGAVATLSVAPNAQMENLAGIGSDQSTGFIFTVVPLFVLMGEILRRTTVAGDVFYVGEQLLRHVPGGMLHASLLGCTAFAAVSGSSPVTASTVGSLTIPHMLGHGYPPRLAAGAAAAGGTLGILIPPSVGFIVYGVVTGTSIADLFLAGIIPGLMLALLFIVTTLIAYPRMARWSAEPAPETSPDRAPRSTARMLLSVISVLVLFVVVIGGIYRGVVTPGESAALGALGALLIGVSIGGLHSRRALAEALRETVLTSGMFLLLLISGLFVAYVVTIVGIPRELALIVSDLGVASWLVMLIIAALLVALGMFLDPMSMLVVMAPILLPTVTAMGYDPVWFGVFFMVAVEVGMITPPVGFNLFVLRRAVPSLEFGDIVKGAAVYLPAFAVGVALLMLFPDLALYLPTR